MSQSIQIIQTFRIPQYGLDGCFTSPLCFLINGARKIYMVMSRILRTSPYRIHEEDSRSGCLREATCQCVPIRGLLWRMSRIDPDMHFRVDEFQHVNRQTIEIIDK
jgi:hypothetical protein